MPTLWEFYQVARRPHELFGRRKRLVGRGYEETSFEMLEVLAGVKKPLSPMIEKFSCKLPDGNLVACWYPPGGMPYCQRTYELWNGDRVTIRIPFDLDSTSYLYRLMKKTIPEEVVRLTLSGSSLGNEAMDYVASEMGIDISRVPRVWSPRFVEEYAGEKGAEWSADHDIVMLFNILCAMDRSSIYYREGRALLNAVFTCGDLDVTLSAFGGYYLPVGKAIRLLLLMDRIHGSPLSLKAKGVLEALAEMVGAKEYRDLLYGYNGQGEELLLGEAGGNSNSRNRYVYLYGSRLLGQMLW